MKKLLLLALLAVTVPSAAQSWAAPGATWYYDFQYFSMTGYERIQNIGDTVIGGKQYNKLQIYRSYYDQSNQQYGSYYVPMLEFTRADSGIVYFYRDSADYVLYDFNAQPGETWVLRSEFEGTPCDTGSVVVDSIATMIVNGDTLRVLRTSSVNWNGITLNYPRIVEKLGGLANLLPMGMCVTDIPQGYNLRCYSDSTGWMWQNPNWNYACDDMMGVEEHSVHHSFSVFADAQSHKIILNGSAITPGAQVEIYDARGQLLVQQTLQTQGTAELDGSALAIGVYFVTVTSGDIRMSQPFFVAGE